MTLRVALPWIGADGMTLRVALPWIGADGMALRVPLWPQAVEEMASSATNVSVCRMAGLRDDVGIGTASVVREPIALRSGW